MIIIIIIVNNNNSHLKFFGHMILSQEAAQQLRRPSGPATFLLVDSFSVVDVQKSLEDCLYGRYNPRRSFTYLSD